MKFGVMIARLNTPYLIELLQEVPVIAVTGARQTGKTTIVQNLESKIDKELRYLDLEFPEDQSKLQDPVLYLEQYSDQCIVLDEIHRMPELFLVLRSLVDRNRKPGRFIILGSASPDLLRDSSESLAGRIAYTRLYPFNLLETAKHKNWKSLFIRGGFPESLLASTDKASRRWRSNFISTYLERELPALGLDANLQMLRKLLLLIAQAQGQVLNMQNFATALGTTAQTVSRYIGFLEKSYLVNRLEPYYSNLKKRLVKSPKLYISDSGLFHSLLGIDDFDALINHPAVGPSWEGAVINQTQSVLADDYRLWFLRTHEGAEADIIITREDRPIMCAEIKWTNAPKMSKGFRNVTEYLQTKTNYLITPEAETYPVAEGVWVTSLKEWLQILHDMKL